MSSTEQSAGAASIDTIINQVMAPVSDAVSAFIFFDIPLFGAQVPLIVLWLIGAGVFFTVYLNFINLRGFRHAIDLVTNKYDHDRAPGEISHFKALATAVSGTVGIGNIAAVPVALSIGGPGATFWLIVAGLLGMSTKFVECTLGVMYRNEHANGVSGGPMYYLQKGLSMRDWPRLGRGLGLFYAAAMVVGCLGIGNMFQSNQATAVFVDVTGGAYSPFAERTWMVGLVMAVATAAIIIGGIRTIAATTSKMVPFMAAAYVFGALTIIVLNADALPGAITAIIDGAFNPQGVTGGVIGVMIIGFQRAAFSNEAGLGSASVAHSAVRTSEPLTEGYVALLEPFIDTVVVCTLTALVILTTIYEPGMADGGVAGIELTTRAFSSTLAWTPIPLAIIAMLFAYSTMIAWSYYGLKAFTHLTGEHHWAELTFKLVFLIFIVIGSSIELDAVIHLSDALVMVIALPNILGLYLLAPVVKAELRAYQARVLG